MRIVLWKRFLYAWTLIALTTVAAYAGTDVRTISLRDDCDPASFNAAVGDGTCVGDGDTTFGDFLDELFSTGGVEKWRFNSNRTEADRAVNARNRGGEFHTFTPVDHFGGGFVEVLNLGQDPVTECAARDNDGELIRDGAGDLIPAAAALATFVPPGGGTANVPLAKGDHKFQCCIHPWMQSTVRVR